MSQPSPLLNEIGEPEIPWGRWVGIFKSYLVAIGGGNFSNVRKQHILLHNLGIQGRKLYEDITGRQVDEEDEEVDAGVDAYEFTLRKLEAHFREKINVVLERHKFFKRVQKKEEKLSTYIAALRDLSATCEFGALTDSLIRDQLVRCTNDQNVQEELLTRNPDLSEAINIAKGIEHTALCVREIKNTAEFNKERGDSKNSVSEETVCNVSEKSKESSRNRTENFHCFRCGSPNHLANNWKCPAKNAICRKCNKKGHFLKLCKTPSVEVHMVKGSEDEEEEDKWYVFQIDEEENEKIHYPTCTISLNGESVLVYADSCSPYTINRKEFFDDKFGKDNIVMETADICPGGYNKEPIPLEAMVRIIISFKNRHTVGKVYVSKKGSSLLGWKHQK